MALETAVEMARRELANYTRAQLIEVIHHPYMQGAQKTAAIQLLGDMDARELKNRHEEIHGKLTNIDGRLVAVEAVAKRPEYKTFSFWFSIFGILMAVIAIAISYLAWQRPNEPVARMKPNIPPSPSAIKEPSGDPVISAHAPSVPEMKKPELLQAKQSLPSPDKVSTATDALPKKDSQ